MLRLEFPNESHKDQYLEMIEEWGQHETIPTDPDNLFVGTTYEEFLQITKDARDNPPEGRVPASLFFLVDSIASRILGAIDIRHHIEHDFLREIGGHIGYGIRPSERKKGYATEALRLGKQEAKNLEIEKILLTCLDENVWSYRTIEANGWIFERDADFNGKKVRRYWITV